MTKREMANMLIDDSHSVWELQDFRWLMRKTKPELEDMIRELVEADIVRANDLW